MRTRILIADDDVTMLNILSEFLDSEGYCVVGKALDGEEALDLCRSLKPDIAVFDLDMPKMTGIQAAKAIMSELPLPIVMLTGYAGADLPARIAEAGIYGCLNKPVDFDELSQMLAIALQRFKEMQKLRGEVKDLWQALECRKWIEKAKGIVMSVRGLTEQQAHNYLQMESQRQSLPLAELAEAIVTARKVSTIEVFGHTGTRRPTKLAVRQTHHSLV